jgi:hypothetical protein
MQHYANDIALGDAWEGHWVRRSPPVVPAVPRAREPMGRLQFKTARQPETEAVQILGVDADFDGLSLRWCCAAIRWRLR